MSKHKYNLNIKTMKRIFKNWFANLKSMKLQRMLKKNVVKFVFEKTDGTQRTAVGTLVSAYLPKVDKSAKQSNRKPNNSVQVFFDMEKNAFRSFKKSNLLSIVGVA